MLFRFMATAAAALSLLAGSALAAPNLEETMAAASRGDPAAANRIGVWYEKGDMGWWGMVSNEKGAEEWHGEVAALLEKVPADSMVYNVDFHI